MKKVGAALIFPSDSTINISIATTMHIERYVKFHLRLMDLRKPFLYWHVNKVGADDLLIHVDRLLTWHDVTPANRSLDLLPSHA